MLQFPLVSIAISLQLTVKNPTHRIECSGVLYRRMPLE
ncbi:Uncharacterised protein [Vibrio cholerae]|nr:Uncharacterised protein [Vibrio cholerae]CSI04951.1 Uncharacterised protein [Vibrio cholerae]